MAENPNVALVRRLYEAFASADVPALSELLDGSTWHVPGENQIAGTYRDADEVMGLFAKTRELTEGTIEWTVHDVVGEATHAVGLDRVTGRRPDGRTIDLNRIVIGHIADGKVSEVWINVEDQYAFDDFWA